MSSLFNYFDEVELDMIIQALQAQETKWNAVGNKPIQGYGKVTEAAKKEKAKWKAEQFKKLQDKISENTY